MKCFLCHKNNFDVAYSLQTKKILRCKNDGLNLACATVHHRINIYQKDYFDNPPHPANSNHKYFLKKLQTIKLLTYKLQPYILDIGCGWGDFEEVLEKEKIPYLGIDVNKEAIEICRKKGLNCIQTKIQQFLVGDENGRNLASPTSNVAGKFNLPRNDEHLREGNFRQNLPKLRFDAITMFQVIEHLKNPLPLLQTAKKLLKPNGVILITTPNNDSPLCKLFGSRWSVYNEPSHFAFYNKSTLKQTLKKAGFNTINVRVDSLRFLSSRYILNRLIRMSSCSPFTTIYKLLTTINLPIPTDPFGDLEAIAEKG